MKRPRKAATAKKAVAKKAAAPRKRAPKPAPEPTWLTAARAAEDKKAADIKVLDVTGISTFTDFFVICTGNTARQTQAIADEIELRLKKRGERPISVEGYSQGEWILTDYGDLVVHTQTPKSRAFYDLERLWREGKTLEIPAA